MDIRIRIFIQKITFISVSHHQTIQLIPPSFLYYFFRMNKIHQSTCNIKSTSTLNTANADPSALVCIVAASTLHLPHTPHKPGAYSNVFSRFCMNFIKLPEIFRIHE